MRALLSVYDKSGIVDFARDLADLVVERVYADVPRAVWPAARLSVLAQLDYLGLLAEPPR